MKHLTLALGLICPFLFQDGATSPHVPRVRWLDVNVDGSEDALVLNARGELRLFLADDGHGFVAADASWGLADLTAVSGIAVNASGDAPVLLISSAAQAPRLLVREGSTFVDATLGSGLEALGPLLHAEFMDYDGDGQLDLQVFPAGGGVLLLHKERSGYYPTELAPERIDTPALAGSIVITQAPRGEAVPHPVNGSTDDRQAGERPHAFGHAPSSSRLESAAHATQGPINIGVNSGVTAEVLTGGPSFCAHGLRDLAGGPCIAASSAPLPGRLLPLGPQFFVDSNGLVGMGTVTPSADLHVQDSNATIRLSSTNPFSQHTSIELSSVGNYTEGMRLRSDDDGLHLSAFTPDRFGVPTNFDHLFVRKSTAANVGIGTDDPQTTLHVAGNTRVISLEARSLTDQITARLVGREATGEGARMALGLENGNETIVFDAEDGSNAAQISLYDRDGTETVELVSQEASGNGAQLSLRKANGVTTVVLDAEFNGAAEFSLFSNTGTETVELVSQEGPGDGAQLALRKTNGTTTILLDAETNEGAEFSMKDDSGLETVELLSDDGNGGQITLLDSGGDATIILDAAFSGSGRITTEVLVITGGADLVEGFETSDACPPGSVVIIDEQHVGALKLSNEPYDMRVAGVVSGAGGVKPGLAMGQAGVLDGATQVALSGRVFVRCTTENGPIRPGQLLTTSSMPGAAMRASDQARANGAVIGKAMGVLESGTGLVLVLVNLQ